MFVSTNVTFLEEDYMSNHKPRSKIVLNELEPSTTSAHSTRVVDDVIIPQISDSQRIPSQDTLLLRRSGRVARQFDRYLGIGKAQGVVYDDSVDDPLTLKHAMKDSNKEEWLKIMNLEMESMYSNLV
ncbi:hypothetical protein ACOSQ2_021204 [Xanthoceras sorbifolium]